MTCILPIELENLVRYAFKNVPNTKIPENLKEAGFEVERLFLSPHDLLPLIEDAWYYVLMYSVVVYYLIIIKRVKSLQKPFHDFIG